MNQAAQKLAPPDIKIEDDGKISKINHFWAFPVWNYEDKKVQVLELTQKTVQAPIKNLVNNPKWGEPKEYDIVVNKEKVGGKTNYTVTLDPKTPLDGEIAKAYITAWKRQWKLVPSAK